MALENNITYAVVVKTDTIEVEGKLEPVYETVGHFTDKNTAEQFIKDYCQGYDAECVIEIKQLDFKVMPKSAKR